MNKNTITVTMTVKDDGSMTIRQFGKNAEESLEKASEASRKASSSLDLMKGSWLKTTAVAAAALYAFEKASALIDKFVSDAARFETLGVVMQVVGNNAGYSGSQMNDFASSLEKTGISMSGARDALTRMTQAQLDLNKSSQLARVAQDAAVIGNINSSEAFKQLVFGIQSAQVEVLRTIGINVNFENSYARVAKETKRAADSFSETEKATVRMNAVLDAGKNIAGTYEAAMGTAGKQMLSLSRHFENIKVGAGLAFTPALAEIIESITGALVNLSGELNSNSKDKIHEWGVNFRIAIIDVEAEMRRLAMLLDLFGGAFNQAKMGLYGVGAAIGYGPSVERFEEAAKAYIEYEERYKNSDKALEDLAKKQIQLEYSLTDAGKASAKAAEDAAEKRRLANAAATKAAQDAADAEKKHQDAITAAAKTAQKTAADDIKTLKSRLSDYQQYYNSLKALMDKNTEDEKKHLEELKAIQQQRIDNQKLGADLIAQINGTSNNMSDQQRYESGRSSLNQQFNDALNISGQDRVKALEDYMKAVAALQQQFKDGITGSKDIFGNTEQIISAKIVAEDAISDINRAMQMRENSLVAIQEAQEKNIEADRLWGQVIRQEAQTAQNEMERLSNIIAELSTQLESMNKTVELTGIDHVSSVVEQITAKINEMHKLAAQPISFNVSGLGYSNSSSGSGLNLDAYLKLDSLNLGNSIPKLATGTDYVPQTGLYMLHKGEAVVPADQNKPSQRSVNISGDIIINVPSSAATGRADDWRYITRNYIVPELRKISA